MQFSLIFFAHDRRFRPFRCIKLYQSRILILSLTFFSSTPSLLALQSFLTYSSCSFFAKTIQSNQMYNFWPFWAISRNSQQRNLPLHQERNCLIFKHFKLNIINSLWLIPSKPWFSTNLDWGYFSPLWLQTIIRTF